MSIEKFIQKIQDMPEFNALSPEEKGKILFLGHNPESKIVRLSDTQRGSLSNTIFSLASNIDSIKPIVTEMLNCRVPVKDSKVFFTDFAEYGQEQHNVILALRSLEQKGYDLIKNVEKPSSIKNKRIRLRVFGPDDTETKAATATKPKGRPSKASKEAEAKAKAAEKEAKASTKEKDTKKDDTAAA